MTSQNNKQSLRLSVLNPQVRERIEKFDTGNDGELDINEAIQGLITLQKQSNNYKKMIWLLIPVLCLVLAGSFGTTLLAINLTKDIHQNDGILTSKVDNTPIRTVEATSKDLMFSSLFSNDYNKISKLHFGTVTLNVNGIYQYTEQDKSKAVYVNSDMVFLGLNQTGSFIINYNQGFETNPMAQRLYQTINNSFSEVSLIMDYYRATYGHQSTFDMIIQYTHMYTVTTSKVPEEYSISDNKNIISTNLVSTTTRMASDKAADNPCGGGYYGYACKQQPCYECTFHNDDPANGLPSQWQECTTVSGAERPWRTNCKKVN